MIGAFAVDPKLFREATAWTARWLPSKPVHPLHAGITLRAASGRLTLSVMGQDVTAQRVLPIERGSDGAAMVSGRLLATMVPTLPPSGPVVITIGGHGTPMVTLESGPARVALPIMEDTHFPALPVESEPVVKVTGSELAYAIKRVAPVASQDHFAGPLVAVRMDVVREFPVQVMASDSRRAARAWAGVWAPALRDAEMLVPATVLAEVARCLAHDVITVGADDSVVSFSSGLETVVVRQTVGPYLVKPVRQAVEYEPPVRAGVPLAEFGRAVKRAMLMRDGQQPLMLDWAPGQVLVYLIGTSTYAGEYMKAEYSGRELRLGVNPRYLLDALDMMEGDTVIIGFDPERPKRPILVVEPDDDSYRHVVVPIDLSRIS